jgi:hypothetical protein
MRPPREAAAWDVEARSLTSSTDRRDAHHCGALRGGPCSAGVAKGRLGPAAAASDEGALLRHRARSRPPARRPSLAFHQHRLGGDLQPSPRRPLASSRRTRAGAGQHCGTMIVGGLLAALQRRGGLRLLGRHGDRHLHGCEHSQSAEPTVDQRGRGHLLARGCGQRGRCGRTFRGGPDGERTWRPGLGQGLETASRRLGEHARAETAKCSLTARARSGVAGRNDGVQCHSSQGHRRCPVGAVRCRGCGPQELRYRRRPVNALCADQLRPNQARRTSAGSCGRWR